MIIEIEAHERRNTMTKKQQAMVDSYNRATVRNSVMFTPDGATPKSVLGSTVRI